MIKVLPRLRATVLAACLAVSGAGLIATSPSAQAAPCDPVLITVNGSNQLLGSREMDRIVRTVRADARRDRVAVSVVPVAYPAEPFTRYVRPNLSFDWDGLARSEALGVTNLTNTIAQVRQSCASRPLMLAGYSQGADVVSQVVNTMSREERATVSVGLLGNPSFLPGLRQDFGNYDRKRRGIRPSLGQVNHQIIAPDVTARTVDACLRGDAICNFNVNDVPTLLNGRSAHFDYVSSGYAERVGHRLWQMRVRTPSTPPATPTPPPSQAEVALDPAGGPLGTNFQVTSGTQCPANSRLVRADWFDPQGVKQAGMGTPVYQGQTWRIRGGFLPGYRPLPLGNWTLRVACYAEDAPDATTVTFSYAPRSVTFTEPYTVTAARSGSTVTVAATSGCPATTTRVRISISAPGTLDAGAGEVAVAPGQPWRTDVALAPGVAGPYTVYATCENDVRGALLDYTMLTIT